MGLNLKPMDVLRVKTKLMYVPIVEPMGVKSKVDGIEPRVDKPMDVS